MFSNKTSKYYLSLQVRQFAQISRLCLTKPDQLPMFQVIPADVDHIDFTWEAKKGSAVPYKITFIHAPSRAMNNPSVNISTEVSSDPLFRFYLTLFCPGYRAHTRGQVQTLLPLHGKGGRASRDAVSGENTFLGSQMTLSEEKEKEF